VSIRRRAEMTELLETIKNTVVVGRKGEIEKQVQQALDSGVDPDRLINDALISAMDVVGRNFSEGKIYVPEMLLSAKTMQQGLNIIKPLLETGESQNQSAIVMATVKGDLHDIGKNLVSMMLEGAGFRIIDLGVDVNIDEMVETLKKEEADILGLSALLTTTMREMREVIKALDTAGLRDRVKVMIGGAPINQAFADKIGADAYGKDAAEAVRLARRLLVG
jgi:5-methyltetrahydrofolate--homocysteine methyltransferase